MMIVSLWLIRNIVSPKRKIIIYRACQSPQTRLSRDSFGDLRRYILERFKTSIKMYTLIAALMINALGKDKSLWEEVKGKLPDQLQEPNHDEILYHAAIFGHVELLPDIETSSACYESLRKSLRVGSRLNLAQLVQAETVPASLITVHELGNDRFTVLKFFETILDVAGA